MSLSPTGTVDPGEAGRLFREGNLAAALTAANAAVRRAPTDIGARVLLVDSLIPNESDANASGPSAIPRTSSAPAARAAGRSGSARRPTSRASTPIGTLIRKISRQSANSTR